MTIDPILFWLLVCFAAPNALFTLLYVIGKFCIVWSKFIDWSLKVVK